MSDAGKERAQIAYEGYGDFVNWRAYNGEKMPQWTELPIHIQEAWKAAIYRVFLDHNT